MFTHSPISHYITTLPPGDALSKATLDEYEAYYGRSTLIDQSEIMKKPIAFPNPPRPPTPGPPRPGPPVPPPAPGPTPPPSPQSLLSYSTDWQQSILAFQAQPSQCPHPNPPPSPGPRRPGPVRPRPNVPTPPPSPHRSADSWIFLITSSLVDSVLTYLTLAMWDGDTTTGGTKPAAAEIDMCSKRQSESIRIPSLADLPREFFTSFCQQCDLESLRGSVSHRELRKQGKHLHEKHSETAAAFDMITTALSENGLIIY